MSGIRLLTTRAAASIPYMPMARALRRLREQTSNYDMAIGSYLGRIHQWRFGAERHQRYDGQRLGVERGYNTRTSLSRPAWRFVRRLTDQLPPVVGSHTSTTRRTRTPISGSVFPKFLSRHQLSLCLVV